MDDLVEKALARWPNVPSIAGWLKLNLSGDWLLTGPVPEGLSITHPRILNFIARNYGCEPDGRYYFQNGPQKAYVTLEYTPWVYRLYPLGTGGLMLVSHTGLVVLPLACFMDEQGRVLIESDLGVGVLHSADMELFSAGLMEHADGQYRHVALWALPESPASTLPEQRIGLRRSKNSCETGTFSREFGLIEIDSASVPARFSFIQQPEVQP